jgi:hypothetical protein
MNRRISVFTILAAGLLFGCAEPPPPPTGQARADAQTLAACRQRADTVYNMRNRDVIYAPPPQVNAPFSGSYGPGVDDRSLSQMFERDSLMNDCVRNTGTESDRTPEPSPPPASPVARP